jgi:hypothetical protein
MYIRSKKEVNMNCKEHKWIIYSTALCPPTLMLYCDHCDVDGQIKKGDFTHKEWCEAYYAPSNPYEWTGEKDIVKKEIRTKNF